VSPEGVVGGLSSRWVVTVTGSTLPQVETASSPSSDQSVPGTFALTIRGVSAR
jgi:hypothetical protein